MTALPPLAAEKIFSIGAFNVTNTYINSSLTVIFFLVVGFLVQRKIEDVPTGIQNFFESILELMLPYFDQVTGSRKKSLQFLPIAGGIFLFILISNWIGVLPGVGSIGFFRIAEGGKEFIPLFRSANTDLNLTLAMAVFGVALSHIIGVATIGFFKYVNKFIKVGDIFIAIKTLKPINIFTALVEFGVGLLEIISEVAKLVSLSLRLFGNIFAGEVLLTVLASIIAYIVPLPFIGLELLVGFIQSMVFSMLVLVYLSVATMPVSAHGGHEGEMAEHGEATDEPKIENTAKHKQLEPAAEI